MSERNIAKDMWCYKSKPLVFNSEYSAMESCVMKVFSDYEDYIFQIPFYSKVNKVFQTLIDKNFVAVSTDCDIPGYSKLLMKSDDFDVQLVRSYLHRSITSLVIFKLKEKRKPINEVAQMHGIVQPANGIKSTEQNRFLEYVKSVINAEFFPS